MRSRTGIVAALAAATALAASKPSPPPQPATGPGGRLAAHAGVRATRLGSGDDEVRLYEPARPSPASAPVVLFLHGWGAMEPRGYLAWIEHLARRGAVVVYPRYQASLRTAPEDFHPHIVAALRAALAELDRPGHVRPDRDRFAVVGHSAGGTEAATYAALAASEGLPPPRAVMAVEPGRGRGLTGRITVPLADPARIPAGTQLLLLVGDRDRLAGDATARDIFRRATAADRRWLITVRSDDHGSPALVADHFAPGAGPHAGADALDYFAYWRLFDELTDAAFAGRSLAIDPRMGSWSDGVPVQALVVETPEPPPPPK
jgi:acetyl esterase/lipase